MNDAFTDRDIAAALQRYLHEHIPLSAAMQVSVLAVDVQGVTLGAPLAPNINHRATVFGGSASALAILSAWALLHQRLAGLDADRRLVIQRNTMNYERPILGAFTARSFLPQPESWPLFMRMLERKARARIAVHALLESDGQRAGLLEGDFVALAVARQNA
ncbi:MAG: YiiD C-terminal domain-containing protein [Steroidobacteraceae bacterium]